MNFTDKNIWITGASSGIGKALAIEFSKYKPKLILSSRNVEELEKTKIICEKNGAECFITPLDLSKVSKIQTIANEVISKFNKIDILVNNGGISQRSLTEETSIDIDRQIMEINYFGNIALTKAVLPNMISNKSGNILTISSIVGKFGFPLRSSYSASKHALHGFYESLRVEVEDKYNIKVNIIIPGRIKTNISINSIQKDGSKYNKMDEGQENGISAEKCAKKIIIAINKNKKESLIGGKELIMVYLRQYLPRIFYNFVKKIKTT